MDNLLDLRTQLQINLNANSSSTFLPPDTLDKALARAYQKCGGAFQWPALMDAKETSSKSGHDYYDYPENWYPQSMWRLEIDGDLWGEQPDGSPLSFNDFLLYKKQNPNSTLKKWSTFATQYFLDVATSSVGNNNISVWGQKIVTPMVEDTDETIFSHSMPLGNEAILEEAQAMLETKEKDLNSENFYSAKAFALLAREWDKISKGQAKYEKSLPFFDVPNFFADRRRGGTSGSSTGNFDF